MVVSEIIFKIFIKGPTPKRVVTTFRSILVLKHKSQTEQNKLM